MHLAPALAAAGHEVKALTLRDLAVKEWKGISIVKYELTGGNTKDINPWILDHESKVIRGKSCLDAAMRLQKHGYIPEIIVAHPGWGESLFIKQIWPEAKLNLYCEYFYNTSGYDVGFDDEFYPMTVQETARVSLKNTNLLLSSQQADKGISPTNFQTDTFPKHIRDKITVIHDGIDTDVLKPNPDVTFALEDGQVLSYGDEVITFVSRALEPYRGFHTFMRSLPKVLTERPKAVVLIVGYEGISYGKEPPKNRSWKQLMCSEVFPKLSSNQMSRIHFLGTLSRSRFTALLQVSMVHVYLTYPFVLSWSLIEAMSVGCAIVASDTNPVHEVLEHNKTGLLFNFFDYDALADSIFLVLADSRLRTRLGTLARKLAVDRYDLFSVCLPEQIIWVEDS